MATTPTPLNQVQSLTCRWLIWFFCRVLTKENTLQSHISASASSLREDLSDYVAHLQLHMALQARNLVPSLKNSPDSREQLLQQTQATFEKHISRQSYLG